MLTTIIIEDDFDSREVLRLLLSQHFPHIKILAQCATATEGLEAIRTLKPQLIFLDVNLPDKTGFDLLRETDHSTFETIFVSAFDHFAAQAFRWSALDFLVKPVTLSLLQEAIDKAERRRQQPAAVEQMRQLLDNINSLQLNKRINKLALPTTADIEFVNLNDIIRVEGDKNYSTFVLNDKRKITVSRTLAEYERLLENTTFMRVQKSHLANLMYVKKYLKGDGGWILMADGSEIPVSPLKREELLERLSEGAKI
jgi:two-component system, LytTR family, response regulator